MFGFTDYKMWRFSIHRSVRCFYGADKRNHYFYLYHLNVCKQKYKHNKTKKVHLVISDLRCCVL